MYKFKIFFVFLLGLSVFIAGCARVSVKRMETDKIVDVSGSWNDTDSRLVAEEMISDCLKRPWLNKFNETNNADPVIIVGTIINRSHEHINSRLFTKNLEKSLLNSGLIKFVASRTEREEIREERDSQQEGYTQRETVTSKGNETGADYMLEGSINSVKDEIKGNYVILYQVNLELIDLGTNQKVWIGQKEIKKQVKKSKFSL